MVFSHVLIFELEDMLNINHLSNAFSLFVSSIERKDNTLSTLTAKIDSSSPSNSKQQPKYIQRTIKDFLLGKTPIILAGDLISMSKAIEVLWASASIPLRKQISFRASFAPADIEGINGLTLVSVQKEFISRWTPNSVVDSSENELTEVKLESVALFLGHLSDNRLYKFMTELHVVNDPLHYAQYEALLAHYDDLAEIENGNTLRQDIRILTKFSPDPANGREIKTAFLNKLLDLIESKKETNVKALRNIEWLAFADGEEIMKEGILKFITGEMEEPGSHSIELLSELIDLSINEKDHNWWHTSVQMAVRLAVTKSNARTLQTIFRIIGSSDGSFDNVFAIIKSLANVDQILRSHLPLKLPSNVVIKLLAVARKNHWYILHAGILLKTLSSKDALENQLVTEQDLDLTKSLGVIFLSERIPSSELIELALKSCNDKLITLSIKAVEKDRTLFRSLHLESSCWMQVWRPLVLKSKDIFEGFAGREKNLVHGILDQIILGNKPDAIILELIAGAKFADISDFKDRRLIWSVLPSSIRNDYIRQSEKTVLSMFLSGKITVDEIEPEIEESITSDSFMTSFLSDNRNDIDPVIQFFEAFQNTKDAFLADYIHYYRSDISSEQSFRLGILIRSRSFDKSARSVHDKARFINSFEIAAKECDDLISSNWWDMLTGSNNRSKGQEHASKNDLSKESQVIQTLPTVVILTAINEEYLAIRKHLVDIIDADRNDTNYEAGLFEFNGRKIAKVFIRECGAKNANAAQETERAIQYFTPDTILFVGIAGSRKPNDFSIGDVIFPEKIYSYEGGKSERDTFVARPDLANLTFTLMEIAKKERRKDDWKNLIKGDWQKTVKADLGVIASGDQIVEHVRSDIGAILTKHFNDTSAVEMEGFGFAKAATRQGRETSGVLVGVVRGISDIIEWDSPTSGVENLDRRPGNAKHFASDTAAAFAFWLIFKTHGKS